MAKARSKTPAKAKRAPGIDHKQQTALNTRSLGVRNSNESTIGPAPDAPDEITSAAPPNVRTLDEPGRASSPMFDEAKVTGKGKTSVPGGPLPEPTSQKVKAGEGEDEGKVPDIHALEDLPPGTTIEIRAEEIVIHAALAGGSAKTFHGTNAKAALASFNQFAENGPELFPSGRTEEEEKEFQRTLDQAVKDSAKRAADAEADKKKAEG